LRICLALLKIADEGGGCPGLPWQSYEPGNLRAEITAPFARVLARHLDDRPDRPAGIGLRAGGRYLLCSGGLSPTVETDRTGTY
jgi:hypothetical protein